VSARRGGDERRARDAACDFYANEFSSVFFSARIRSSSMSSRFERFDANRRLGRLKGASARARAPPRRKDGRRCRAHDQSGGVPRGGVPGASRPARQTTSLGSRITASHASSRSLGRNASSSASHILHASRRTCLLPRTTSSPRGASLRSARTSPATARLVRNRVISPCRAGLATWLSGPILGPTPKTPLARPTRRATPS